MVEIEPLPASSDSESDSDSSNKSGSDDDEERSRMLRRVEMKPDSDSEEEEEPQETSTRKKDDAWEDESGDSGDSDGDESSSEDENQNLSLQERLSRQEEKQSTQRTISSLKEQRERRSKAASIAKERLVQVKETPVHKKKSKHAPTEASSRRRHNKTLNESGIGVEIGSNRYQARDPRMSNLSGHYNADQHEQRFGFLDQVQQTELATLKRKIKAHAMTGKRGQRERRKLEMTKDDTPFALQSQLEQLQQRVARQNQYKLETKAKKAVKQKLKERVEEGKGGVYFPKRSELKKMQMEAKVEEIQKEKGKLGLHKYLAKRRKKQKSQHAKKMRTQGGGFDG